MKTLYATLQQKSNLLSVYYTAGYPTLDSTVKIAKELENAGVDLIEIGMPFSDPLADGPTIQASSAKAINNGMNIPFLFNQIKTLRQEVKIPVILMGYLNPVLQFGFERFLQQCKECGINGLILPDLPLQEYESNYKKLFDFYGIANILLITPQTPEQRIRQIDQASNGFIYAVSSSSITGQKDGFTEDQITYFKRLSHMNLKNPFLIGFGISGKSDFITACKYGKGAIIGSAFIKSLGTNIPIKEFISTIKG